MSEQTATNLFIVPPINKYERLYQGLLNRFISYDQLGNRLIYLAEQAKILRQTDTLTELALILSNFPIESYTRIGQYYLALSVYRKGQGSLEQAASIFEQVASDGPLKYRAEAMISLSGISWASQQPNETMRYCLEAAQAGNFNTTIKALTGIAILKGREGYHRCAVNDLEKLYPMFKYATPYAYFDYLNSYAVELSEVGRITEAKDISTLVCNSPFALYDHEWRKTLLAIDRKLYKSRSSIRVNEPKPLPISQQATTNVIQFPSGERMAKDEEFKELPMTALHVLAMVVRTVMKDRITEQEVEKICDNFKIALEVIFTDEE